MKSAAVLIDSWKIDIFTKHLNNAKYSFETLAGITKHTLNLRVQFDSVAALHAVIAAANKECAENKGSIQ